jgi:hypothetical protein
MESTSNQGWTVTGRVEFHLNGGMTKVSFWVGGLKYIEFDTGVIPLELRAIGTWLKLRMSPSGVWAVEGKGEPEPYLEAWINRWPHPELPK